MPCLDSGLWGNTTLHVAPPCHQREMPFRLPVGMLCCPSQRRPFHPKRDVLLAGLKGLTQTDHCPRVHNTLHKLGSPATCTLGRSLCRKEPLKALPRVQVARDCHWHCWRLPCSLGQCSFALLLHLKGRELPLLVLRMVILEDDTNGRSATHLH